MRRFAFSAAFLGAAFLGSTVSAATINVNGDLADWGIAVKNGGATGSPGNVYVQAVNPAAQANGASDFNDRWSQVGLPASDFVTPVFGASFDGGWRSDTASDTVGVPAQRVFYQLEDQDDTDATFNGPNYGGQDYDSEFLGATFEGGVMYVALVTGQRNDNGLANFSPGDFRIEIGTNSGSRLYGLEVGGGAGSNTATDINLGDAGTSYTINSSGHTQSAATPVNANQKAGSIFQTTNGNWKTDPFFGNYTEFNGGTYVGDAIGYKYYQLGSGANQHAVVELAIQLNLLGTYAEQAYVKSIQWTMGCGNDGLLLNTPMGGGNEVTPEPASLAIWGLGGICALAFARRRMQRKAA